MREIKFRAWDDFKKKMITEDVSSYCSFKDNGVVNCFNPLGNNIIMQYTGLKDKNGKEIYEGDIVNGGIYDGSYCYGKIVFKNACFYAESIGRFNEGISEHWQHFEVIGNIYENPDLL